MVSDKSCMEALVSSELAAFSCEIAERLVMTSEIKLLAFSDLSTFSVISLVREMD